MKNSNLEIEFDRENFVTALNLFDKKINEIKVCFDDISHIIKNLNDEDTWSSDTSRDIVENSTEIEKSFKNANDEFVSYRDYLIKVLESHEIEDNKANKTIDDNIKNLDR